MNHRPLVSIVVPTYNRATDLQNLLENIALQSEGLEGVLEVCISNNGSTDATREVVASFQKKYPVQIHYRENETNLGFDRNLLKVFGMPQGKFVWLFGDDDVVLPRGIQKVIDFIKGNCNDTTGFALFGHKSYAVDPKTKKETIYFTSLNADKGAIYEIELADMLGIRFDNTFGSISLFNNHFLQKVLQEEQEMITAAIGSYFMHTFLYQLMLLKYRQLKILRFNEAIVGVGVPSFKLYVEDEFEVFYAGRRRLNNLLLSSQYMDTHYRGVIIKEQRKLLKDMAKEMFMMRTFASFNYFSFWGCVSLFFKEASAQDAILFSIFFTLFSVFSSSTLRFFYKNFLKIKYKKTWKILWSHAMLNAEIAKGTRRISSFAE